MAPDTSKDIFKNLSRIHKTPLQVQKFLRKIKYNREPRGATLRSAASALRTRSAHCLEAAFVAAAILEHHGYKPLVLSLESKDDLDHVLFVFRERGRWGAIGRSREDGLHGRAPVFRTLRELALSYFDPFIDNTGRLEAYGLANLDDTGADWRRSKKHVWVAERYLIDLYHVALPKHDRRYNKWYARYLKTGLSGARKPYWW